MSEPVRILIADDHTVVRTGLGALLGANADMVVVASAANGEEAHRLAVEHRPDVVLMDLSMPEVDGIEATRRILGDDPGITVLVLTSFSDRARVLEALDAGALGYLLKDSEPDDLLRAVRAAARGEAPIDPRVTRALLERRASGRAPTELTEREREVLALVAQGLANKLIARRLGIAEKTVKAHLTNVFARIGVTDRTQAALWARSHGIGPSD